MLGKGSCDPEEDMYPSLLGYSSNASVQASRYRVCFSSEISSLVFSLEDLSRYEKGVLKSLLIMLGPVWSFVSFAVCSMALSYPTHKCL